jgi:hypothetical protein
MLFLTVEQHQQVLRQLLALGRGLPESVPTHEGGFEHTSLMVCFLLHNLSVADCLLRLAMCFGNTWFPVTASYSMVRTVFEADVTAHYITQDPRARSRQYIDLGAILKKQSINACARHRASTDRCWREAMTLEWEHHWAQQEREVVRRYEEVAPHFHGYGSKWSGRTLRQMATEVDHAEAYDTFYADLSSFAHADVRLADRFLQRRESTWTWSQMADEVDVGRVFRYADSFLECYLTLFGREFGFWPASAVDDCWMV